MYKKAARHEGPVQPAWGIPGSRAGGLSPRVVSADENPYDSENGHYARDDDDAGLLSAVADWGARGADETFDSDDDTGANLVASDVGTEHSSDQETT